MSTYGLKPKFQSILRPVVRLLANIGVTANMVSILAIIVSILAALLYAMEPKNGLVVACYILALLPLRMVLNAVDGMLAREFAMESKFGRYLDEAGNLVSDIALYLPLVIVMNGISIFMATAFVVLTAATELAAIFPCLYGGVRRNDGPMGKSDRAFAISMLVFFMYLLGNSNPFFAFVLLVLDVMLVFTIVNRLEEGGVL